MGTDMPEGHIPPMRTASEIDVASRYVQSAFNALADHAESLLQGDEVVTAHLRAEDSDFVRINGCKVRQAGNVRQRTVTLKLIDGKRHAAAEMTLTGTRSADSLRVNTAISELRALLPNLPDDPHLMYNTTPVSTERHGDPVIPDSHDAVDAILREGAGLDLVGIYAGGGVYEGFANSLGQRNWFSSFSFNFDFSVYERADKAVKCGYAGLSWDAADFAAKVQSAREQRKILQREARTIKPGQYRVYLAPAAVNEIVSLLSWGAFSLKAQKTRQSPLNRLVDGHTALNPAISLTEATSRGVAAGFDSAGFAKHDSVRLIHEGSHGGSLVSPRSAAEFGVPTNGAASDEGPTSLDLAAGDLADNKILDALGTGLWINNLWYLNYSDRSHCRMTGMTRFATFWVEDGKIVAPLNVMRFDETLYRMFGDNLLGLTSNREMLLAADTYFRRSTSSARLPGALIDDFTFTL